jgi:predicted nucleic acid-binding Zn ribbon protein
VVKKLVARPRETKRGRGEAALGPLLDSVLADLDLGSRLREQLALKAWPEIAGEVVRAHTRPETVRDGVLIVATDTPAWAQELQMRRVQLLEQLSARIGGGVVRDIHFRSGLSRRDQARPARRPAPAEIKLSRRQARRIRKAAARIEEPELRARAERAFLALARMTQWRKRAGWRRCRRCGQWSASGKRLCSSCAQAAKGRRKK